MDRTEDRSKEPKTKLVLDDGRIESIQEFISPEELYQDLIERVRKYHPSDDISMIEKAYRLADNAHQGQVRKSGEPYIIHPLCVAIILADLELDLETIEAGLLHDVVEDTKVSNEDIVRMFGKEVAALVDGGRTGWRTVRNGRCLFGGRRDQAAASASCGQFRQ